MSQTLPPDDEPPISEDERRLIEDLKNQKKLPADPEPKPEPAAEPQSGWYLNEYAEWVPVSSESPRAEPPAPITLPPDESASPVPPPPPPDPPVTSTAPESVKELPASRPAGASAAQGPMPATGGQRPTARPAGGSSPDQPFGAFAKPNSESAQPPGRSRGVWLSLVGTAIGLIVVVVIGIQILLPGDDPPSGQLITASATGTVATQAAEAVSSTTTTPTPTPSPSVEPTATLDPAEAKRDLFALGLEQYDQQEWAAAVETFEQVFAVDPDYTLVRELHDVLSASLYNQNIAEIDGSPNPERKDVEAIRARFRRIAEILDGVSPEDQALADTYQDRRDRAAEWTRILDQYLDARTQLDSNMWTEAIDILEGIPPTRDDYGVSVRILDVAAQRVVAYKSYGDQLAAEGRYEEAQVQYEQAREIGNASDIDTSSVATAIAALPVPTAAPTPIPPSPVPAKLRVSVSSYNDDPSCISIGVSGINTSGWFFSVDGLALRGNIDAAGNGRLCGLGWQQEVTISIFNASGRAVSGGSGVPSRGSAIMVAVWR